MGYAILEQKTRPTTHPHTRHGDYLPLPAIDGKERHVQVTECRGIVVKPVPRVVSVVVVVV